jgi:hypothetical protein
MVNTRNNNNGQGCNPNNQVNSQFEQLITNQKHLMQAMLQSLQQLQPNQQPQQQQQAPPPLPQSRLEEFLRTHPCNFSQAKDPMDVVDWLKSVEKKLEITQCSNHERVPFLSFQLFGTMADWWETYRNTQLNAETISWNEFNDHF